MKETNVKKRILISVVIAFAIIVIAVVILVNNGNIETLEKTTLTNLQLSSSKNIKFGDSLTFEIDYSGELDFASMIIKNKETEQGYYMSIVPGDTTRVIDRTGLYTDMQPGNYYISDVYLNPSGDDVHYSKNPEDENTLKLNFDIEFTIDEK